MTNEHGTLGEPWTDLLAVFDTHAVDYLVVGGYAVGFHARPRFTKDIDVWVGNAPDNLARVRAALESFGAPAEDDGKDKGDPQPKK